MPNAKTHSKAKGRGFEQPQKPHEHWHLDISYINFKSTFVYLVALIDGFSRYLMHMICARPSKRRMSSARS